jgi:hypothetical protein
MPRAGDQVRGVGHGSWLEQCPDSFDDVFAKAYGLTWLVALLVTVGVFVWGRLVITPAVRAMNKVPLDASGAATPELVAATAA